MRIVKSMLVAGMVAVVLPSVAHAQWYVSGEAGASVAEKSKVTGGSVGNDTDYNTGVTGLGAVGYSYGAPRAEVELGYRYNDINTVQGASASGNIGVFSAMANGLYDFMPDSVWHPFVGAGIGYAHLNVDNASVGSKTRYSGSDDQFAYQGIVGIAYDITKALQVKADYRYFATLDPTYSSGSANYKGEYEDHSFMIGVTFKFLPPPPPPPAPVMAAAPPAPPPPPPAPAPMAAPAVVPLHNFIVFFDFDKTAITAQAHAIIEQAAAQANSGAAVHINLTGHTDLAGGASYNQKLSERRAEAVKAALVKLGVPVGEINTVGKGKSEPLVPTKDGVREPQNRRVEIMFN